MDQILIYGANGYTGRLICNEVKSRNIDFIIAGRNRQEIGEMGDELDSPTKVFDLQDESLIDLSDVSLVLNCAGPFSKTAEPMIKACLDQRVHYLDITGEIEIFEYAHSMDQVAKRKGVILLPGTGFDVVPTDCLSLLLKKELPEANSLELAFYSKGGLGSQGTRKTSVEGLANGVFIREDGELTQIPLASETIELDFGLEDDLERLCMAIPWGDVSTAYYTTGIPNIKVYMPIHPSRIKWMKVMRYFKPIISLGIVQKILKWRIEKGPKGPDEETLQEGKTYVWGKVTDPHGNEIEKRMITPNGYKLTVDASLKIVQKIIHGDYPNGFHTPAGLFRAELLSELNGIEFLE